MEAMRSCKVFNQMAQIEHTVMVALMLSMIDEFIVIWKRFSGQYLMASSSHLMKGMSKMVTTYCRDSCTNK
jgi:hypothetical protein